MAGPPVYEDGLFELSIDPSENLLDKPLTKGFPHSKPIYWNLEKALCIGI